jgi:hypothetical protein
MDKSKLTNFVMNTRSNSIVRDDEFTTADLVEMFPDRFNEIDAARKYCVRMQQRGELSRRSVVVNGHRANAYRIVDKPSEKNGSNKNGNRNKKVRDNISAPIGI